MNVKKFYEDYNKLIKCLILLLIFYVFAFIINNYFKPFFIIAFLIFLCNPLNNFINKLGISNRKVSAIISILFINFASLFLLFLLGNYFFNKLYDFIVYDYGNFAKEFQALIVQLSNKTDINFSDVSLKLQKHYYNILNNDFLTKGAAYTTDGILSYFIGNIAAYFILVDKYAIFNSFRKLLPNKDFGLVKDKYREINQIINIELILVLLITLQTILGFWALNINNAFILGIICGLLDIIPVIGTILVFLPLILINVIRGRYIIGIGLLILYIMLQLIRQIMEAKFISRKLEVHPLLILLSVYIGLNVFGVIGVFLGPLYIISAKEIVKI